MLGILKILDADAKDFYPVVNLSVGYPIGIANLTIYRLCIGLVYPQIPNIPGLGKIL